MSIPDARRDLALDVLCQALSSYLQWLQSAWAEGADRRQTAAPLHDVDRVLATAGGHRPAEPGERRQLEAMVAAMRELDDGPLAALVAAHELAVGDELVVAAAWWAEADPQLAVALGCAHDDGNRRYASSALLRLVLEPFGIDAAPALDADHVLVAGGVVREGAGAAGPVTLTDAARRALASGVVRAGAPLEERRLPERLAATRDALAARWRQPAGAEPSVTVLLGDDRATLRTLVRHAADATGRVACDGSRPAPELRLVGRFGGTVVVLDHERGGEVVPRWTAGDGPLVVLAPVGDEEVRAVGRQALVVEVPPPTTAERSAAWERALTAVGARPSIEIRALAADLGSRFGFDEGTIDATVDRAVRLAAWAGDPVDDLAIWEACRRQPSYGLERLASRVTPTFALDDVIVDDDVRAQLDEILAHVRLQSVVLEAWGFRHLLPRGRGVAALFAGPPGTGKTMAAEALAKALHQDLFRIDLSSVVSKWIGETEKNLGQAFDEAERMGAVLFFDEADALFGRRTEVRDSHDRYANLEVNYLLQRVETFTGLVLLASNRRSALDEAFTRRLRFVVRFDLPDRSTRRRLWARAFPTAVDRDELDWDALAAAELAGASIQSVALSAAFLAAADHGRVTAKHVSAAMQREHDKLGRSYVALPLTAATAEEAQEAS